MAVSHGQRAAHNIQGASDSEDDLAAPTISNNLATTSNTENIRGPRAMPGNGIKATKAATKRKVASVKPRYALQDRTNVQATAAGEDGMEEYEDDDDDGGKPTNKRARHSANTNSSRKKTCARAASREPSEGPPTDQASAAPKPVASKGAKRGRPKKMLELALAGIPETQRTSPGEDEQIEQSIEIAEGEIQTDTAAQPMPPEQTSTSVQPATALLQPKLSAKSMPGRPGNVKAFPFSRERSGSASDVGALRERRGGDPELRRRHEDLTEKYEALNLKYQSLQEIGREEANANFEKLKRASDQRAKDASELISALKRELSELRKSNSDRSAEITHLQKQVNDLTVTSTKLGAQNKEMNDSLQSSKNETKAIEAKLIAARQQISDMATQEQDRTSRIPSSATKVPNGSIGRGVSANTIDAVKDARMKENLYSDLTGLIVRGVKRKEGEDEYDCIQTGRNGTLHFHLSVANDSSTANPKTPSGLSYEQAEFAYEPLLDEGRDRDLLDLLPDYLTEEICFPRNHAVKFYTRVVDSMTKKIVLEDEDEDQSNE